MWMCSRCQTINNGEGSGARCPRCGNVNTEPTLPPHIANQLTESVAKAQQTTIPNTTTSVTSRNSQSKFDHLELSNLKVAEHLPDPPSSNPNIPEPEQEGEELSADEYESVTSESKSPITPAVAITLLVIAIIAIGISFTFGGANSYDGSLEYGPAASVSRLFAGIKPASLVGVWTGTDRAGQAPTPVSYLFATDGTVTITTLNPDGTDNTHSGKYVVKGNQLSISSDTLNFTSKLTNDGTTAVFTNASDLLMLKSPRALVGEWSGMIPVDQSDLKVKLKFNADGSVIMTGPSESGKIESINGHYLLIGSWLQLQLASQEPLAAPLQGSPKLIPNDNSLNIMLDPTAVKPSSTTSVSFVRQ